MDDGQKSAYVQNLCREVDFIAQKIKDGGYELPMADTVYFGGGTPTLLSSRDFEDILMAVGDSFGICDGAEITAETNPKTADCQKLCDIRTLGINRLSIGMQSSHDSELRALGRIHTFADFCATYNDARRVGFDNISADLMYGIPDQTPQSFDESVRALSEMDPEHISSYCLTIEEGTPFARRRNELKLPTEDEVADMYAAMTNTLSGYGYEKYEISNFAHKGRESRHNNKYWKLENYLGFGPAAHSCFDGVRYAHSRDISAYIGGQSIYCDVQKIGKNEAMGEYVMLGMRLSRGIDIAEFEELFGASFDQNFGAKLKKYAPEYVYYDGKTFRFTDRGMFVSNYILSDVLDF